MTADVTLGAALPEISSDITVDGTSSNFSIDGDDSYRIFSVTSGGDLTVNRLSLKNGRTDQGPAIYSRDAVINISNSTISNNQVADTGAGFAVTLVNGSLNISNSSFNDNQNGAIFANGSSVTISNSSFSNNRNTGTSGSIDFHKSTSTISNSSFSNNQNGVITAFLGSLTITNSNFSNNQAADVPSAIRSASQSSLTIRHSTFSNNRNSGGRARSAIRVGVNLAISNSIIYGNSPSDCDATLATNSGNIIGTGNCGSPYSTADPLLGSWVSPADGSPGYFPLQAGSPAIDAVSCITGITTDIRGTSRPQGSNCDIGAYEYDSGSPPPTVDPNITPTTPPTVDPNITPTTAPTVDPNITPTMTPTVDPNVTPTTAPTATDTPGGRTLISFLGVDISYDDLFGDVGEVTFGISEQGITQLQSIMGDLIFSSFDSAVKLGEYILSHKVCATVRFIANHFGEITQLFEIITNRVLWQAVGTLKGYLAGQTVGAPSGGAGGTVIVPGFGTAAGTVVGGVSLGGILAYGGSTIAVVAAGETIKFFVSNYAIEPLIESVMADLDEKGDGHALSPVIKELARLPQLGLELAVTVMIEAAQTATIATFNQTRGLLAAGNIKWSPAAIARDIVQKYPSHLARAYAKHTTLEIAKDAGVIAIENYAEDLVELLLTGVAKWISGNDDAEFDCDDLPSIQEVKQALGNTFSLLQQSAALLVRELTDDLRYVIQNTNRIIDDFKQLAADLQTRQEFDIAMMHKDLCSVSLFKSVYPTNVFCQETVSKLLTDTICLIPIPTVTFGDRTIGALSCDSLDIPPIVNLLTISPTYLVSWQVATGVSNYVLGYRTAASPFSPWKDIIVTGNSYQLTTNELPPGASGFQLRIRALNGIFEGDPVLYPANPNDPTQFAAAPAIIIHENVPAPPADDSDDRDDSGAAATSIPQAEPRASTCANLPPHLRVQHYHRSTQCNVLSRASVGHPDLVGNFIAGVDIWGYVGAVVEVCIQGSGPLRFVDTSEMPRSVRPLPAFSDGGLTCAWVERVGQVILVPGPPSPPKLKPATPGPATQALSNCMVTLEYILNFRQGPGGPIRKTADGSDFWLPALVSLTALERTADWFYVDYHGERGWISADFVIERGDCQADAATLPTALPAWEPSPLPANPTAPAPDVTPVGMR